MNKYSVGDTFTPLREAELRIPGTDGKARQLGKSVLKPQGARETEMILNLTSRRQRADRRKKYSAVLKRQLREAKHPSLFLPIPNRHVHARHCHSHGSISPWNFAGCSTCCPARAAPHGPHRRLGVSDCCRYSHRFSRTGGRPDARTSQCLKFVATGRDRDDRESDSGQNLLDYFFTQGYLR